PTLGVDFRSTVNAPTWPVMFERCFFQGFDKAFCINSTLAYPLNYLKFQDCAFVDNGYCVYASSVSEQIHAKSGITRQCVWSFEFLGNKCHHNRYLLYINVQKGLCRIDNNNCEGTLGDEKAQQEGYAIDVEIGQRATASICHNHFELNRTPLLRVVSSTSLDSQVTAMGNNTDGVQAEMNRSYFERVKVETTLSAELCNCMFEGHQRVQRKALLSGKSVVFTPDECLMPLQKSSAQAVVTSVSEQPSLLKKWVDTSFGRLCMGCYYANSFATTPVLNTLLKYQSGMRYLNLEMLYVRRSPSVLFSNIYLRIGYMKGDRTLRVADVSPGHLYSPWSGSFRMRVQIPLEEVSGSTDLHVQMAVYTDTKHLAEVGELFIGCRHLLLSADRVDLYEQMATRYDMNLSIAEEEQFLIEKGERFVMGVFDVSCLEGGCCLPATEFVHSSGTDYVVAPVRPLGSTWTDGLHTFRLIGLAAELTDYQHVKYYIDQSVDQMEWGKRYRSLSPRLLGSGAGNRKDLEGNSGRCLCPGSTFYAANEGKKYILNDNGKWVVRS
ncbi:MAG: hypothetical protein SPK32_00300, partial [Bacteroidaceae bacterium]|nr:hypothetical protein [Bacteroidaceae bacterium]